jgi:2-polyprenyl-3-methyl-5-hydroxy-6-metoxy-1,4-benzoquinol methylase
MEFAARGTVTEPFCPLCGSAGGDVRYDYGQMKIVRCIVCGLWRTCPRLSPDELTAYYETHYYSEDIERAGRYDQWRAANAAVWSTNARLVVREARRRGLGGTSPRLLDVGCGHGFFLEQCRALGLECRGIESSPHAVRYARDTLKLEVRELGLEHLPAGEQYHVITLWGVLEHVPDPLRTMELVRARLLPGGITWVMTPNTNALERFLKGRNYFNFLNQSHLTHFHRATLRALLAKAGFRNVRRYIHWGGGTYRGPAAVAQYIARWLCLGTELRFIAER